MLDVHCRELGGCPCNHKALSLIVYSGVTFGLSSQVAE